MLESRQSSWRTRWGRRIAGALVAGVALAGAPAMHEAADATPSGILWGAYPGSRAGESDQQATVRLEQQAGRKFDVVRDFLLWNDAFPTSYHTWLRDTGREPIISVRAVTTANKSVLWSSIASAQPGSTIYNQIVGWANKIKAYGGPMYFSFNHEPESATNQRLGTAAQFIAAWRKIHDVFVAQGVTNVKYMWIMTDYSFLAAKSDRRYAQKWYPGDAYVDAIGEDAYNWFTCRTQYNSPWKSLEQIATPFRDFGLQHPGKQMWFAEWATTEDPNQPGRKAQWIKDAQALLKQPSWSQFVGMSYFDSDKRPGCSWPVSSSTASLSAFQGMGADAFYGG
jgi:hypothetical protein